MVETENFIKEVSEEVRKDKLFKTIKHYRWIMFGLIVVIILAVSGYEYYKYNRTVNSEANGKLLNDFIESLEKQSEGSFDLQSDNKFIDSILKLHKAKFFVVKEDFNSAEKLYKDVIENPSSGRFLKDYSMLMIYLLSPAETLEDKNKIKILDQLSAPDSPLQILALEQKLLLFLKLNDLEKAKYHISLITENPRVTSQQLERIKEVKELYEFD